MYPDRRGRQPEPASLPRQQPATRVKTYPPFPADGPNAGKFLQIYCDGISWLLFATPDACRFHNQILSRFLDGAAIPYRWTSSETLEVTDRRIEVIGGGRFRLDPLGQHLELWDDSHAYGRFDASLVANQLASAGAPWDRLRLQIH
jgi:hypothetical protein